jgi:hypothetical protein
MNSDKPTGRGDLPGDRPSSPSGERTLRDDLREARLRDRMADDDTLGADQPGRDIMGKDLMGDRTLDERDQPVGGLPGEVPGLTAASDGMLAPDLRARPREDRLGDRVDEPIGGDPGAPGDAQFMKEGAKDVLGSHPVGTAIGAVGGAVAVGAAIGTIAGPVGTAVGAALGLAAGALAGKGIADMADPEGESEFWRTNWQTREYVDPTLDYERDYSPAYRYGVDAYSRFPERHYDEIETDLSAGWDEARGESRLEWEHARHAARDAWHRVKDAAERAMPGDADNDGR